MRNITVISKNKHSLVTITRCLAESGSWIVKCWKTFLRFKKLISTDWLNDPVQAAAFAAGVFQGT